MTPRRVVPVLALLLIALFAGLGSLWIASPGLQYDECLFVLAAYPHNDIPIAYTMHFHRRPVALMIIDYLGALKGWLYIPILRGRPASAALIRLPALLLGAASLYFLYLLARRAFGPPTALAAVALAATDPSYLFTTRLDWGPVAIQHVCLLAGACGVLRWWQKRRLLDLALGFFAMGVGIFDKATFLWLLAALVVAAAIVFPRQFAVALRPRPLAAALAGLLIGSAPFLYYNWKWKGATFHHQAERTGQYGEKLRALQFTLDGMALASWFSRDMEGTPLDPPDRAARIAYEIAPREQAVPTLLAPAAVLSFLLLPALPFLPYGRGMLFTLLFCLLAFLAMLPIQGAGSVHHIALLLPFPQLFVAAGLTGARDAVRRWFKGRWGRRAATALLWLVVLALAAANLRVVAYYYFRILGYGGGTGWSEAIYSLDRALENRQPEKIVLLDWGMSNQLRLLSGDRLPIYEAPEPQGSGYDTHVLEGFLAKPRAVFVRYAAGEPPAFPQIAAAFLEAAAHRGYRMEIMETIRDRRGRPIYDLLAARPVPAASSRPRRPH
ncbi:MAG TPA: glycosyltransferase family 39 protein [Bryobacterales bacterium]|nr:glycosyltransferase family 39 protein [Bryobacterales bacterium]